jgi:hypothetical protein
MQGTVGWQAQSVHTSSGDCLGLELREGLGGGVIEHEAERPLGCRHLRALGWSTGPRAALPSPGHNSKVYGA